MAKPRRALTTQELAAAPMATLQKERNWYREKVRRAHEAVRFPKPFGKSAAISRALQPYESKRYKKLMEDLPSLKELKTYTREDYIKDIETMAAYLADPLTNRPMFEKIKKAQEESGEFVDEKGNVLVSGKLTTEEALDLMLSAEDEDLSDYKRHAAGSPDRYRVIKEWEEENATRTLTRKQRQELWEERGYTEEEIQVLARAKKQAVLRSEELRREQRDQQFDDLLTRRVNRWNNTDRGWRSPF